jgi:hypothetical protein
MKMTYEYNDSIEYDNSGKDSKYNDYININNNIQKITDEYDNNIINIIIDFIKDEILKSNIRYEIVKPILLYILYYLIPFIIFIIFLNFITNIIAVYLVFKYLV